MSDGARIEVAQVVTRFIAGAGGVATVSAARAGDVPGDATVFFSRGCGAVRATTTLLPLDVGRASVLGGVLGGPALRANDSISCA